MECATIGEMADTGEFSTDTVFGEWVSLVFGDVDLPDSDADRLLDYSDFDSTETPIATQVA